MIDVGPIDIANLPELLAGPIVRRVTRTRVSIWLAVKSASTIEVEVASVAGGATSTASATSVRIGRHLRIAMVTVAAPGGQLTAGELYEYSIRLDGTPLDLAFLDVRPSPAKPTFLAPPATLSDLRMVHASCRRPHAQRRDGLPLAADKIATPERPHLLVLSGDQIYADDVATALAARIRRIADEIVDIDDGAVFPNVDLRGRAEKNKEFGITGGSADHLWGLGEFYAHYLLAWSPVLWPDNWPQWSEAQDGTVTIVPDLPGPGADPRLTAGFDDAEVWSTEIRNLVQYREGIPAVRVLLANTPTLMIFDDHEVADDWNIDFLWVQGMAGNDPGRRIIANGLQAFVCFQHWGNVPDRYADSASAENAALAAAGWASSGPSATAATADAGQRTRLGAHAAPAGTDLPLALRDLSSGVRYDFRLGPADGWPAHLVFLDERTVRFLDEDDKPAARIGPAALDLMWPAPTGNQADTPTILVAPAPVLGMHTWEQLIQPAAGFSRDGAIALDIEGWSHHRASFEHLLARIHAWRTVVIISGDVHFGSTQSMVYEAGGTTSHCAQLSASAAKYSGAAHRVLHLLGEAMERLGLTRVRTYVGWDALDGNQRNALEQAPSGVLPWDDGLDVMLGRVFRDGIAQPAVIPEEVASAYRLDQIGPAHQWRYTITPHSDNTGMNGVQSIQSAVPALGWSGWDPDKSVATVRALQAADLQRIGRVYVGLPQYAFITFSAGATLQVEQALTFAVGDDPASGSVHTTTTRVDLG